MKHITTKKISKKGLFFLALVFLMLDIIMMGLLQSRPFHWTRANYIVTLLLGTSWLLLISCACSSALVGAIVHDNFGPELALSALIGIIGNILVERTLAISFARILLASFLMGVFVVMAQTLFTSMEWWTILQIIANIIIVIVFMKCMI